MKDESVRKSPREFVLEQRKCLLASFLLGILIGGYLMASAGHMKEWKGTDHVASISDAARASRRNSPVASAVPEGDGRANTRHVKGISASEASVSSRFNSSLLVHLPLPLAGIVGRENRQNGAKTRTKVYGSLRTGPFPRLSANLSYHKEAVKQKNKNVLAAVCFTGIPRAVALTYKNQVDAFFLNLNGNYTVFVYGVPDLHFYELFLHHPSVMSIQPQTPIEGIKMHRKPLEKGRIQSVAQQFNALYQCKEMMKAYERKNNVKFEFLIRMRFDLWFFTPIANISSLDRSFVHVPAQYSVCAGYNDRFAIIPRQHADAYPDVVNTMRNPGNYTGAVCSEAILRETLERHRAPVMKQKWRMGLMRETGVINWIYNSHIRK